VVGISQVSVQFSKTNQQPFPSQKAPPSQHPAANGEYAPKVSEEHPMASSDGLAPGSRRAAQCLPAPSNPLTGRQQWERRPTEHISDRSVGFLIPGAYAGPALMPM